MPRGPGIRCRGGHGLLMGAAALRVTQEEDEKQRLDSQDVVDRRGSCLPALTRLLFSRGLGADDAPCAPVMGHRGAAGVATGPGAASRASTTVAASASEP